MAPALLERIIPGLGRRNKKKGFVALFSVARSDVITKGIDERVLPVWSEINVLALRACIQLFVRRIEAGLNADWGLRPYWSRLHYVEIITVGYWMMLYFIRLFRDKALLEQVSENTLMTLSTRWVDWWTDKLKLPNLTLPNEWLRGDSLLSIGQSLYDQVCELLSLETSIAKRTVGVVAFLIVSDLEADAFRDTA